MSHGTLGTPSHGLSKALSMGLVLIICPLKINEPMNFRAAWYACDMKEIKPLHLTLLSLLNEGVTQNFWVRTWVRKGWENYESYITISIFRFSSKLMVLMVVSPLDGPLLLVNSLFVPEVSATYRQNY